MEKSGRWEDWEKDYLITHFDTSTAAEVAAHLGRTVQSVNEMKRKLGLKKNKKNVKPEDINRMMAQHREIQESTPIADLDEAQQRRFFMNQLEKSPNWMECKLMFDEYELDVYRNKYVEILMTLGNVTEVEKGSIHIMVCSHIKMNRYMKLEKEYRDMAAGGDPDAAAKAISLHREIREMVDIYMKAEDTLNASRKQRIKEEGDQRMSLIELIKELEKKEQRDKLGREADALKQIQKLEEARLTDEGFVR